MLISKKNVLITGASGFFGRVLTPHLANDPKLKIMAGVRAPVGLFSDDVTETILGDLNSLPNLGAILSEVDCVVHCAARAHILKEDATDPLPIFMQANCEATLNIARQAADAGVKRFVFLSSIGVNGNQTFGTPFRADDTPAPNAPYAVSKLAAETGLKKIAKETGLEVVIIRPPLIIGPKPVGNLLTLSRLIEKGMPLPFGRATSNRRSLISASRLADLIHLCLTHDKAPGQVFLAADPCPLHTRAILERLAVETGQTLRLVPVPIGLMRTILRALGRRTMVDQLFGDLEVDPSETISRLGWDR